MLDHGIVHDCIIVNQIEGILGTILDSLDNDDDSVVRNFT